ncbi:unnamed protein product [Lota lota]
MGLYRGVSWATGQVMWTAVFLLFLQEVQMRGAGLGVHQGPQLAGNPMSGSARSAGYLRAGAALGAGLLPGGMKGPKPGLGNPSQAADKAGYDTTAAAAGGPANGYGANQKGYGAPDTRAISSSARANGPSAGANGPGAAVKGLNSGYDRGFQTGKGQLRAQSADQQKVSSNKGVSVASPDQIHESLGGFPLVDTQGKHQKMPPPLLQSNMFSPEPEFTPEPNPEEPEPTQAQEQNVNQIPEEPVTDVLLEATPQPAETESGPEVPQGPQSSPESSPKEHHLVPDIGYVTGSALPEQNAPETALLPGAELTGLLAPEGVDGLAPVPETAAITKGDVGQEVVPERMVIQHQLQTPGEGSLVEIASKPEKSAGASVSVEGSKAAKPGDAWNL